MPVSVVDPLLAALAPAEESPGRVGGRLRAHTVVTEPEVEPLGPVGVVELVEPVDDPVLLVPTGRRSQRAEVQLHPGRFGHDPALCLLVIPQATRGGRFNAIGAGARG